MAGRTNRVGELTGALALLASLVLAACQARAPNPAPRADLNALYEAKQFFALREELERVEDDGLAGTLLLRAAVAQAFNALEASDAHIARALQAAEIDEATKLELLRLRRGNAFRWHDYASGSEAAREVLALPETLSTPEDREDDENMARLLAALEGVPPQTVRVSGDTEVTLSENAVGGKRVPLRVNGHERGYLFDTGANLSVLMHSEAAELGLSILPAGIDVGSSTGDKNKADLAVADELVIGNHAFENVVFLVFPDELLTIPEVGLRLEGIIGFPVFEAMKEIRFGPGDRFSSPAEPARRSVSNLALDLLDPIAWVTYDGHDFICRLDSGANTTQFYEPFYRAHQERVERLGTLREITTAGVGSQRERRVYEMPALELGAGGRTVTVEKASVFTEPHVRDDENYLYCNLGLDVLGRFESYVVNFVSMTFLLEE